MDNILLIYNPRAGNTFFRYSLDYFIQEFEKKGYEIRVFRSAEPGQIQTYLEHCSLRDTAAVFAAGGDGTVQEVVNGLMERGSSLPVGVIPAGTQNDFARQLGLDQDVETAIRQLSQMKAEEKDLGEINGRYFIHSCRMGFLAATKQKVSLDMKNSLGRTAYYLKGVGQLTKARPFTVRIQVPGEEEEKSIEERLIFLTVTLPGDGKLQIVGIRSGIYKMTKSLIQLKREEEGQVRLRGEEFLVETDHPGVAVDVDGEAETDLPLRLKIHPRALRFFVKP